MLAAMLPGICRPASAESGERTHVSERQDHPANLAHSAQRANPAAPRPEDRVDINHAALDELLRVPGLTHSWALRIVRYRPYRTKADLLDQGILSDVVYNRIKDFVIAHREKQ